MRTIVVGGYGFFGSLAASCLRAEGLRPLVASRRPGADLTLDVEDGASLLRALRPGDVLLDAVGPFQRRSMALIEAAIGVGCDVVDLADSLAYVRQIYVLENRIAAAGIRVFTACSSISAVSAAMIQLSGIHDAQPPRSVTGLLVPATRYTAVRGTAASLYLSVGRPVEILSEGRLIAVPGWSKTHTMRLPAPLAQRTGHLFETADAITLPRRWPSLRQVEFYVDTNVLGLNALFSLAAGSPALRRWIDRLQRPGLFLARGLGRRYSGLAYEIESASGKIARLCLVADRNGHFIPIAPAVLAVRSLTAGQIAQRGLIPPDRHVEPHKLMEWLAARGIRATGIGAHQDAIDAMRQC